MEVSKGFSLGKTKAAKPRGAASKIWSQEFTRLPIAELRNLCGWDELSNIGARIELSNLDAWKKLSNLGAGLS